MYVDGACSAVVLVTPHSAEQDLAGEDLAGVLGEELQQFVFHVGEIQRASCDGRLIGLYIEGKCAVLHEVGLGDPTTFPEQVTQTSFELYRVKRRQTEVIEQVVAQREVTQLATAHEHE